ncbi:MAG: hypothetical protein ABSE40_23160 [Candidatus Sulfotelmatobacter sp.]
MSNFKALAAVVVLIACTMLGQAQTKVVVTNTGTNPVPIAPAAGSEMGVSDVQNPALNPFQKNFTISGTTPTLTFSSPATSGERFVIEFVSAKCSDKDVVSVSTEIAAGTGKYYFPAGNAFSQQTRFYSDGETSITVKATVSGNTCNVSVSGYIFKFAVG